MRFIKSKLSPLFIATFFDQVSVNISAPVLTFIFFSQLSSLFPSHASLATRAFWYGMCIGVAHIGGLISSPILSSLSDVFGRKKLLILAALSTFFFGISCAIGVFFGSLLLVFLGKAVGGMLSRANPIALAVVGDVSDPAKKVVSMGYLQLVISIGAFVGPVLGGFLAHRYAFGFFNYSLPYFVATFFAILTVFCLWFFFKETLEIKKKARYAVSDFLDLLKDKRIRRICLLLLLTQFIWSGYYQYLPPILKTEFHFEPHQLGIFIGVVALWLAVASGLILPWLKRFFGLRQITTISLFLMLLGSVITVLVLSIKPLPQSLLWVGAVPMAMGDVIVYSSIVALLSDLVEKESQGIVMGLCFIMVSLMWAVTGFVGGIFGLLHLSIIIYLGLLVALLIFAKRFVSLSFKF